MTISELMSDSGVCGAERSCARGCCWLGAAAGARRGKPGESKQLIRNLFKYNVAKFWQHADPYAIIAINLHL